MFFRCMVLIWMLSNEGSHFSYRRGQLCDAKNLLSAMPVMAGNSQHQTQGMETSQDPEQIRFEVELEFVQCLANPHYLNFLAQRGYFKDKRFVNYLHYLQYWKEPAYAKYLKFPQCLHFLELLQYEHFRRELANAQCVKFIEDQQLLHWQHYTRRRMRLQQSHLESTQQQQQQLAQQQQQQGVAGAAGGVAASGAATQPTGPGIMQAPLPPQQHPHQHQQQQQQHPSQQQQQQQQMASQMRTGQQDQKPLQQGSTTQQTMK